MEHGLPPGHRYLIPLLLPPVDQEPGGAEPAPVRRDPTARKPGPAAPDPSPTPINPHRSLARTLLAAQWGERGGAGRTGAGGASGGRRRPPGGARGGRRRRLGAERGGAARGGHAVRQPAYRAHHRADGRERQVHHREHGPGVSGGGGAARRAGGPRDGAGRGRPRGPPHRPCRPTGGAVVRGRREAGTPRLGSRPPAAGPRQGLRSTGRASALDSVSAGRPERREAPSHLTAGVSLPQGGKFHS